MQARTAAALRKWDHQELMTSVTQPQISVQTFSLSQQRRDEREKEEEEGETPRIICWPVLIGAFIIQFFVPSVLSSHGVYLSYLLSTGRLSFSAALLPPAVFSATWSFVDPWCRHAGLKHRGADSRLLAGCGVLLLAMSLAISSLTVFSPIRIFTFGIIGGVGCSLAVSQCETQLSLHSPPQQTFSLTVSYIAQALGQFLIPLILVGLLAAFGAAGAPLVHCALVLHGLVGALLFRTAPKATASNSMSIQLSTYSSLAEDPVESGVSTGRSWRNPMDTSCVETPIDEEEEDEENGRLRNHMGVEIMPRILEEEEEEEEEEIEEPEDVTSCTDTATTNSGQRRSLRDSWCPAAPLSIYLPNTEDTTVKGDSPKPLLTPSSLSGLPLRQFEFQQSCCVQCSQRVQSSIREGCTTIANCLRNLWHPALIPGLMVNSMVRLVALGVVTIAPILAQHMLYLPRHEAAFSIAIIGFGWLCLGVCTPCILAAGARKHTNLVYVAACLLSAAGLYMMSQVQNYDKLTVASVVMGMSHGALILTSPLVLRRLWSENMNSLKAQSYLDHGTGLVIITLAVIAYYLVDSVIGYCVMLLALAGMQTCMGLASLTWVVIQRIRFRFHLEVQRTWRATEACTDWGAGVLHTS